MHPRHTLHALFTMAVIVLVSSCQENEPSVAPAPSLAAAKATAGETDTPAPESAKPRVRKVTGAYPPVGPFPFPPEKAVVDAGFEDRDELMWTLVKAIDAGDADLLRDFLVEEDFYLERLFPEFVKEKPALEGRGQFHWDHIEMKSLTGILDLIRMYSGKGLEFRLLVPEGVKEYATIRLHRRPVVIAYDPASGAVRSYDFINDIVEFDGKFKLLAYPN